MSYITAALIASATLTAITAALTGGNIEYIWASAIFNTFFCSAIALVKYHEHKKDKEKLIKGWNKKS